MSTSSLISEIDFEHGRSTEISQPSVPNHFSKIETLLAVIMGSSVL